MINLHVYINQSVGGAVFRYIWEQKNGKKVLFFLFSQISDAAFGPQTGLVQDQMKKEMIKKVKR